MSKTEQIELKLFGLEQRGEKDVRADVFAKKISDLVKALKAADRQENGKKTHDFFITDLQHSSAYATVSERLVDPFHPATASSVCTLHSVAKSVRDGSGIPKGTDLVIAKTISAIGKGADKSFSHGEIGIVGDKSSVVRIDTHFARRADRALADFNTNDNVVPLFEGVAFGTFDGVLKEVDLRGTIARAKLILEIGGIEIDCTCNSITVDNLREALDQRVTITGAAHYSGQSRLPEQVEIKRIDPLGKSGNLAKWRGQFDLPYPSDKDIW